MPCNTKFQKEDEKLATWKAMGTQTGDPMDRQHYDQLDYILVPKRWSNGMLNAESDLGANINTDHAPVWSTCRFKLKKIEHQGKTQSGTTR